MKANEDIYYNLEEWFEEHKEQWRDHRLGFKCPACDGTGGEFETITDIGEGIQYDCGYCHGTGHIGLWKKLMSLNDFALEYRFGWFCHRIYKVFHRRKRD